MPKSSFQLVRFLLVWFTALVALQVAAEPASEVDGCAVLSSADAKQLAQYQFESDELKTTPLDPEQRYRVGEIRVVRQPIFEDESAVWFQRLANRVHTVTRDPVVKSVLTFDAGSEISAWQLAEAERALRRKTYFYDARVIARRVCGDVVDIDVVTRDVWTLNPRLIFLRTGGENDFGFGLSDTNVLGTGKAASIGFKRDQEREGWTFIYEDPNIGGSRWSGRTRVNDNDDGSLVNLGIERPFYSLETPYSVGAQVLTFDREEQLYLLGDDFFRFDADTRSFSVFGGLSKGVVNGVAQRWLAGIRYEEQTFDLPQVFAQDRKLAYPFIAYQRVDNDFDTKLNVDRIYRTEDIALGKSWYAELGYSDDDFGGDGSKLVFNAWFRDTDRLADRQLLSYGFNLHGNYDTDDGRTEDFIADAFANYRFNHAEQFAFFASARIAATRRLPIDKQLLLGGDTGMRGYPNRYQAGDRRFVVTFEERYYSNLYPLKMFRLGAAVFLDVGRAWFEDEVPPWIPGPLDGEAFDTLVDVGFGLRMESTRTRRDFIVHLDVGFPLTSGPDVRDVEFTVTAKRSL